MDGLRAALSFGQQQFAAAALGDARRTRRLIGLADRLAAHPGGTLPNKLPVPSELKAMYRLMNDDEVTHAAVIASPCAVTHQKMAAADGPVLVIHDGTELDYTGLHSIETLGPLGTGSTRGYIAHNALAVEADSGRVIGLVYQHLVKRARPADGESRKQRCDRADRESRWWKDASQHVPTAPPGRQYVEVGDRGSDVLEFIDYLESAGKQYVLRSKHNRRIELENGTKTKLHDFARQLPAGATRPFDVPAGPGRAARQATVTVAWARVTIRVPKQPRGEIRGVPLTTWVVILREVDPPTGVEPLEWILLTNVPVETSEDAWVRLAWYERRWIVEEYHKGLKTGCQIEDMQFTSEESLQPAIALVSVVAVTLLQLRDLSRDEHAAERPARELFAPTLVAALSGWRYHERRDLTVREFCYALARLGGHQNRKGDHPPGWLVLWRGWTKLQLATQFTIDTDAPKSG